MRGYDSRSGRFALAGSVELRTLSPRAVNALGRHGIRTREQARKTDAINLRSGERNCGRKTLEDVAHWMDGSSKEANTASNPKAH